MTKPIRISPYNKFKEIEEKLKSKLNINALPIIAESKLSKHSAEWYGHVVIKLDLEKDEELIKGYYGFSNDKYFYSWEADDSALPKNFELLIKEPIERVAFLLEIMNDNAVPLRFTVLGGSYHQTERPAHKQATIDTLIDIFNKL